MSRDELKKYYDILELKPTSSLHDVHNAYARLKKLYSEDSVALAALADEFPEKKRKKVLRQIHEAYAKLQEAFRAESMNPVSEPPPEASPMIRPLIVESYSGSVLREVRESSGIKPEEICRRLKLRPELLKNIEDEKFEALPEAPYLKGHLKNLATCLGLNPDRVAEDYLRRCPEQKSK